MRRSTSDLLVIHGLRLKGFTASENLAAVLQLPESVVVDILDRAAEIGFARHRGGARSGWSLTAEGRKENERMLAVELTEAGLRDQVTAAYNAFRALNPRLLAVCTRWQISDVDRQELNDHQDKAYDAGVIADLAEIHDAITPICDDLGSLLERFSSYGPRLTAALAEIQAGNTEWFTKPTIDSYHTVWFELHEDLLATLGLDRATEHP